MALCGICSCVPVFRVHIVMFLWLCATRLKKLELIVLCVEHGNDNSRCAWCLGLQLYRLFEEPFTGFSVEHSVYV
jgi:hypothetical protein